MIYCLEWIRVVSVCGSIGNNWYFLIYNEECFFVIYGGQVWGCQNVGIGVVVYGLYYCVLFILDYVGN